MTALIQAITMKPNWETKIKDITILNKWRQEFEDQGVNRNVIQIVFDLLCKSVKTQHFYAGQSYDSWHLKVGVSLNDIWPPNKYCTCDCIVCQGKEYFLEDHEDSHDENEIDDFIRKRDNILKKYKNIQCKCYGSATELPLKYLRDHIQYQMNLIPPDLKARFVEHVKDFQARKGWRDYHPGSNNQMVDIIHPSLYCFVKGVTFVKEAERKEVESLTERSSLLQWLPADFCIHRDPTTNEPIRTEIRSYINNLDRDDPANEALYQDIADIFTHCVPNFERLLTQMNAEKRIKDIIPYEQKDVILTDCQVIVKIANCEVDSEHPSFNEGSWHLEGISTEQIIATSVYYFEMNNLEPNYLRFRTTITKTPFAIPYDGLDYPQDCFEYVSRHYPMKRLHKDNQNFISSAIPLGRIPTKESLSVFFPNYLQHRVSEIRLDKTNDNNSSDRGNRGILVYFLINPFERVLSTANIPPQQKPVTKDDGSVQPETSLEEAKMYRELLMFERKFEYSEQNSFHQRDYSLCEH